MKNSLEYLYLNLSFCFFKYRSQAREVPAQTPRSQREPQTAMSRSFNRDLTSQTPRAAPSVPSASKTPRQSNPHTERNPSLGRRAQTPRESKSRSELKVDSARRSKTFHGAEERPVSRAIGKPLFDYYGWQQNEKLDLDAHLRTSPL